MSSHTQNPSRRNTLKALSLALSAPACLPIASAAQAASMSPELQGLAHEFDPLYTEWCVHKWNSNADHIEFRGALSRKTGIDLSHGRDYPAPDEDPAFTEALHSLLRERGEEGRFDSEAYNDLLDGKIFDLAHEILSHETTALEGIAVQIRALTVIGSNDWEEPDCDTYSLLQFVKNIYALVGLRYPSRPTEADLNV
jgi:hypothetical protein